MKYLIQNEANKEMYTLKFLYVTVGYDMWSYVYTTCKASILLSVLSLKSWYFNESGTMWHWGYIQLSLECIQDNTFILVLVVIRTIHDLFVCLKWKRFVLVYLFTYQLKNLDFFQILSIINEFVMKTHVDNFLVDIRFGSS